MVGLGDWVKQLLPQLCRVPFPQQKLPVRPGTGGVPDYQGA